MDLSGKEIVLGVSGGIACYKALEIVRGIREAGGQVSVVMTKAAMEFVKPLTFQTLSERPVATSLFSMEEERPPPIFLEINYFFGRRGLGGSLRYYERVDNAVNAWLNSLGLRL